ncbi:MAG: MFS transporter, partial [Caldimonas sp.]
SSTVFGAFSVALLAAAVVGPIAGRLIDRRDGRHVLMAANVVFACGLAALGLAHDAWGLFGAWMVMGVAMGSGLYEAAFATLVRLYGKGSRGAITGVTLFAGFASTIGWPLTAWLEAHLGWQGACFAWAGVHLIFALPLNASLPSPTARSVGVGVGMAPDAHAPVAHARLAYILLAFVFAITWFVSTAMAAHLPRLLVAGGATLTAAVGIGALVGPAQVAGRLLEFGLLRKMQPLFAARIATLMHPLGVAALMIFGMPAAAAFAILHGLGNGILTIAIGTLPLLMFGSKGYGQRQGMLMIPARVVQAMAPWLFGVCLSRWGSHALLLSAALGIVAFGALALLPRPQAASAIPPPAQPS